MAYENNDTSKVTFNEAGSLIDRLNTIQLKLNSCFANLKAINITENNYTPEPVYNFEVAYQYLNIFLSELWQDLDVPEQQDGKKMRDAIREFLERNPIWNITFNQGTNTREAKLNVRVFVVLEKYLSEYRYMLNKFKKKHGFGNPNQNDVTKSIIRM